MAIIGVFLQSTIPALSKKDVRNFHKAGFSVRLGRLSAKRVFLKDQHAQA
jgi:hypothetical protein